MRTRMSFTSRQAAAVILGTVLVGLSVRRAVVVIVRSYGRRREGVNVVCGRLSNHDSSNLLRSLQALPLLASNTDLKPVVSSLFV